MATYCKIPNAWYAGKGKTMRAVKRMGIGVTVPFGKKHRALAALGLLQDMALGCMAE